VYGTAAFTGLMVIRVITHDGFYTNVQVYEIIKSWEAKEYDLLCHEASKYTLLKVWPNLTCLLHGAEPFL